MGITLWDYILRRAEEVTDRALEGIGTLEEWERLRPERYREFMISMGLEPMPERCELEPTTYGEFEGEGYRAVKVAYRILPDCWGTGTIYYPDPLPGGRLPAILYVSGHKAIGSLGYQHHGIMWARRGYVAFVFDTVEQHDNPGDHHGVYSGRRPDWISRGYTAAGGELLNSMRALDLLSSLPEVDPDRIGATGISGGGAHSFYLAVADGRIKAVATVAGVTSLKYTLAKRNFLHHCDCMYTLNSFGRDNADFAALVAPRALLFCYAKDDSLFSPEEYRTLAGKVLKVYRLYGAEEKCRLFEYPGPHSYSPEAVEEINRWMDRYVAGEEHPMVPLGPEEENPERVVTVFNGKPPHPDRLDILPELLTVRGGVELPQGPEDWPGIREEAKGRLREGPLRWLEENDEELEVWPVGDWLAGETKYLAYEGGIGGMGVWIEVWDPPEADGKAVVALAGPDDDPSDLLSQLGARLSGHTLALVEPRGTGLRGFGRKEYRFLLRAGSLVGVTPVMMWTYDIMEALRFLRTLPAFRGKEVYLFGNGEAAVACLYCAIFDDSISGAVLKGLPRSHLDGGCIPGIIRVLDIQQAVGLLAPRPVGLVDWPAPRSQWPERLYGRLGVPERYILGGSLKVVVDKVMYAGGG